VSILKHLVIGAAQLGKFAAVGMAQKQMTAEYKKKARRAGAAGVPVDAPTEGCTPCAAKKKGADMANGIWK